ncbi:hypothetical protein ABXT66_10310 [Candidatus Levibacter sp. Uisw_134_01]|uniref:hypothetical protein n=1 Tax=Candidatus Levibacter sp. Uisw_134_01 TaxID=3230999 RepID=UPI003D5BBA74
MNNQEISVLTNPLPIGRYFVSEITRSFYRSTKHKLIKRNFFNHPYFRGHFAVTRSLVEGFAKIGVNSNYNPTQLSELAKIVIVLAGVRTLRQAIKLKQSGKIQKLFAGPNIVNFSTDYNSIIASPEIDAVIVPCNWVLEHYVQDNPLLKERIFSWPTGVDTFFWSPDPSMMSDEILIFEKQGVGPIDSIVPYATYLQRLGWKINILRYGEFDHQDYCELLKKSCLMLGFVHVESQGIAWAEAWSANVPTLLWRNNQYLLNSRILNVSTAPYLCDQNGLFFNDFEHFKKQFFYWQNHRDQFRPREWTLGNMSDESCARQIYKKVISC